MDLAREPNKQWNIMVMVMVIPILIDVIRTVHKSLEKGKKELENRRIEINRVTTLLRSA